MLLVACCHCEELRITTFVVVYAVLGWSAWGWCVGVVSRPTRMGTPLLPARFAWIFTNRILPFSVGTAVLQSFPVLGGFAQTTVGVIPPPATHPVLNHAFLSHESRPVTNYLSQANVSRTRPSTTGRAALLFSSTFPPSTLWWRANGLLPLFSCLVPPAWPRARNRIIFYHGGHISKGKVGVTQAIRHNVTQDPAVADGPVDSATRTHSGSRVSPSCPRPVPHGELKKPSFV